jgi:hypothetical protein
MAAPGSGTRKPAAARKRAAPAPRGRRAREAVATTIDPERRRALIAEAAYRIAATRNFAPGRELADWLEAERSVDLQLQAEGGREKAAVSHE